MKNIKSEMAAYREAVRHLWNSTFLPLDDSLRYGTCLELFEQIDRLMFTALICKPLGIELKSRTSSEPIAYLRVVPISATDVPVLINRSIPASGYWDDPIKTINTSDVDFAFISFFDWDGYNQKDMHYYRVRIINCKSEPSLNGKDALIETLNAQVFLIE